MIQLNEPNAIDNLVKELYEEYKLALKNNDIHSNVIDPFSALLEASFNQMDYDTWLSAEKARQVQKTLQNSIGTLHENIIGSIAGCSNLSVGRIIDIVCEEKKIIAEIKNKFNTTKGNHKVAIYDDIAHVLSSKEGQFTGYYVEVIPKKTEGYNKPFQPSDNTIQKGDKKRPLNEKIRIIDGKTFYSLITGEDNAIYQIYDMIQQALQKLGLETEDTFKELLYQAYGRRE
jgi:effector-binding domain-containing protein